MKRPKGLFAVLVLGCINLALYVTAMIFAYLGATMYADSIAAELQTTQDELFHQFLMGVFIDAPFFVLGYVLIFIAIWKRTRAWYLGSIVYFVVYWTGSTLYDAIVSDSLSVVRLLIPITVMILMLLPSSRKYLIRKEP